MTNASTTIMTQGKEMRLARGLGWFSIGLGLAEILAPGAVARMAGIPRRKNLIRLLGFRELASGIGILAQRRPTTALWSRVGGDLMDLSVLGAAFASEDSHKGRLGAATAVVAGVTALDIYCSQQVTRNPGAKNSAIHIEKSITVNRSPEELYAFWHQFESLPTFMNHLESVRNLGENRSHWVAKGPAGTRVEWDAEIIQDKPNELIAWRSLVGADVDNAGSVRFERAPGDRGTIVRIKLQYSPPAGVLGATVAKLFGETPEKQVPVDLHHFKQLMETGEVVKTEGQSAGRATSTSPKYDDFVRT
ncbi:MAG TPA: SRPBCC family protein [Clostridia bacterium]|nr:SRPBCC family protein [Clostridia bacterium]